MEDQPLVQLRVASIVLAKYHISLGQDYSMFMALRQRSSTSASGSIRLQNSAFANEQDFPEALVRPFENYVKGHMINPVSQPAALVSSLQGIGHGHLLHLLC
jgi:hypothetical protein